MPIETILYFDLERSSDGISFIPLASGLSPNIREFIDSEVPGPPTFTFYYRLTGVTSALTPIPYNVVSVTTEPNHAFKWAKKIGGTASSHSAGVFGVTADSANNVIVCGNFAGTVNFDADTLSGSASQNAIGDSIRTSSGNGDIFVAKYDSAGKFLWVKSFGGSGNDSAAAVAVDSLGNIYVTGFFSGAINFGTGVISGQGSTDIFLLKLNGTTGGAIWARGFGSGLPDQGFSIKTDSLNNVIISGFFGGIIGGTIDFNQAGPGFEIPGAPVTFTVSSNSIFVAKYDIDGTIQWAKSYGENTSNNGTSLAINRTDNSVYLAGMFGGTINFGPATLTAAGSADIFVLKLNSSGTALVAKQFTVTGLTRAVGAIAVGPSGEWVIVGNFRGTIDFGDGTGVKTYHGQVDAFVAKFNSSSVCQWSVNYGPSQFNEGNSPVCAAIDSQGNIIEGGTFQGSFDTGTGTWTFPAGGTTDYGIFEYDLSGLFIWDGRTAQGAGNNKTQACCFDNNRNIIHAGYFAQNAYFGPGGFTAAPGGSCAFIAKFGP